MKGESYYQTTGTGFDGTKTSCTPAQVAALDAMLAAFWGDDRSSRITISIRHRGVSGSGRRCTAKLPVCWTRVNNPNACCCDGFERERGGTEINITRGKPRAKNPVVARVNLKGRAT